MAQTHPRLVLVRQDSDSRRRGLSPSELPRRRRRGPRATGRATVPVTPTTNHNSATAAVAVSASASGAGTRSLLLRVRPALLALAVQRCCQFSHLARGPGVGTKDTRTALRLDSDTPRSSVRTLPYRLLRLMRAYWENVLYALPTLLTRIIRDVGNDIELSLDSDTPALRRQFEPCLTVTAGRVCAWAAVPTPARRPDNLKPRRAYQASESILPRMRQHRCGPTGWTGFFPMVKSGEFEGKNRSAHVGQCQRPGAIAFESGFNPVEDAPTPMPGSMSLYATVHEIYNTSTKLEIFFVPETSRRRPPGQPELGSGSR